MAQSVLPTDSTPDAPSSRRPQSRSLLLVKGAFVAAFVVFIAEGLRIFVGANFHTVIPGRCYRCAQPTAAFLESSQRNYGVRTIINLRDENIGEPWYDEEDEARKALKITLKNAGLSSKEQPPEVDFHTFVKAIKEAEEPVLIHCANGNDRSGFASAVYLMMRTDTPVAEARGQLSLRYGHFAWTKASCLHRILDSYESWLTETGKTHSPDHFYYWGINVYRQESLR